MTVEALTPLEPEIIVRPMMILDRAADDKTLRDVEVTTVEDGEGDRWKLRLTATDGTEVVLGTQNSDGYQSWLVLEAISA